MELQNCSSPEVHTTLLARLPPFKQFCFTSWVLFLKLWPSPLVVLQHFSHQEEARNAEVGLLDAALQRSATVEVNTVSFFFALLAFLCHFVPFDNRKITGTDGKEKC